jgi:Uma2 family endonuclease
LVNNVLRIAYFVLKSEYATRNTLMAKSWPTPPAAVTKAVTKAEIEYPESDGKPMAETDVHLEQMVDGLLHPLKELYAPNPNVYVTGNINLYYSKGNPKLVVAPDVFVVFGIPKKQRRTYKLWVEGKPPDVVFELTSKATRRQDLNEKRYLYEELGVQEYFLFDPMREYLEPPLRGFRLEGGFYAPLVPEPFGEGEWQLESQVLGLQLRTDGQMLRLFNPATGRYLLTRPEEAQARRQAEQRAAEEAIARRAAEQRTAKEAAARQQAEQRAAEAEAEVARLRAMLRDQSE